MQSYLGESCKTVSCAFSLCSPFVEDRCTAHQRQRQVCPFLFSELVSGEVSSGSCVPIVTVLNSRTVARDQPGKYSKSFFRGRKKGKREEGKEGNAQRDIL